MVWKVLYTLPTRMATPMCSMLIVTMMVCGSVPTMPTLAMSGMATTDLFSVLATHFISLPTYWESFVL